MAERQVGERRAQQAGHDAAVLAPGADRRLGITELNDERSSRLERVRPIPRGVSSPAHAMTPFAVPTIWWLAFGATIALELATGTVYLLMIGGGMAAGAVAAQLGHSVVVQLLVAAAVGGCGTVLWHRHRRRQSGAALTPENRDVNQDIGAVIEVPAWAADRSARVTYRGAGWTVRLRGDAPARPGPHRVVAVEGNWLVLAPASID